MMKKLVVENLVGLSYLTQLNFTLIKHDLNQNVKSLSANSFYTIFTIFSVVNWNSLHFNMFKDCF